MRNQDNYVSAYDFVMGQLSLYDYSDDDHLHVLKLKVWALDGPITSDDATLVDEVLLAPVDHYSSLKNELVFVDRYLRTVTDELADGEEPYNSLVRSRNASLQDFVRTPKEDGSLPEDWEMPYASRPPLSGDSEIEEMADMVAGKILDGEITSAFDLVTKAASDNIDTLTAQQDKTIEMSMTPAETEASAAVAGLAELAREDFNNVREMNDAHDEIREIVALYAPEAPQGPAATIEDPTWDGTLPKPDPVPNPIQWSGSSVVLVNFPTRREQVSDVRNHSSHKGMINEPLSIGGYRFVVRSAETYAVKSLDRVNMVTSVSPDKHNQVEWDHASWLYAHYYVESDADAGTSVPYLKPLGVTKATMSSAHLARHDELDRRWKNINRLREDIMMQSGHRSRIESMIDLEATDIKPDMVAHLADRVEHKRNTTEILKERCMFGEFV